MARTRVSVAAGALALALALGGCAGSDGTQGAEGTAGTEGTTGGESPTSGDGTTAPSATPATTPATSSPSPGADTPTDTRTDTDTGDAPDASVPFDAPGTVVESGPAADALLTVTGVRVARHDSFDRVVFDLAGTGTPGWRVEYVDDALDDGSGLPIEVAGDHVLQVRISGTGIPTDTGFDEYGGAPLNLDGDAVEQVVYRFTFEGYSTAFIGTDDRTPFRVFALSDPTRLVVDVADDD